jgi:hypothetical protein
VTYLTKITVKRRASALLGVSQLSGQNVYLLTLIADIAVLGCPDNQALFQQAEDDEALVESIMPLKKFWSSMRHSQSPEACPARRSFQIPRRRFGIVCLGGSNPSKNSQL